MARELRFMRCPGACGEMKAISVAVSYDGMGRESVVPSKCDDCMRAELRAKSRAEQLDQSARS